MIESEAEVLRVEADHAWVRIRPHTPCGHCDPESGCKSVALTRLFGGKQEFRVRNPLQAQPGDWVLVAVEENLLLRSALWGYGLPLALLMLGALLGYFLVPPALANWATAAGAVSGVALALIVLRLRRARQSEPEIVRKPEPGLPMISPCKNKPREGG